MNEGVPFSEYRLDVATFKKRPKSDLIVPQYKIITPLAPITRFNWTSFLIRDFAEGRADWERQHLFLEWFRLKTGFDWESSMESFMDAGSWNIMTGRERELFLDIFRVLPHSTIEAFEANPRQRLEIQLTGVLDSDVPWFMQRYNLAEMNIDQFRSTLNQNF